MKNKKEIKEDFIDLLDHYFAIRNTIRHINNSGRVSIDYVNEIYDKLEKVRQELKKRTKNL